MWSSLLKCIRIPPFLSRRQFNYICFSVGQYANHGSLRAKYLRRRVAKQTISRCRYLQLCIPHTHQSSPRRYLAPVSIQRPISAMWISIIKIRGSRERLSFIMRIPILSRRHFYTETVPDHVDSFSAWYHHSGDIISAMTTKIIGVSILYSSVCSAADQGKHQSSASLAFVKGIHRWPGNSPHKGKVTPKMFQFDDVIMVFQERRFQDLDRLSTNRPFLNSLEWKNRNF